MISKKVMLPEADKLALGHV